MIYINSSIEALCVAFEKNSQICSNILVPKVLLVGLMCQQCNFTHSKYRFSVLLLPLVRMCDSRKLCIVTSNVLDGFLSHADMMYSQVCELNECKCIFNKTKQNTAQQNETKHNKTRQYSKSILPLEASKHAGQAYKGY